jgi:hypothetical protein
MEWLRTHKVTEVGSAQLTPDMVQQRIEDTDGI